MEKTIDELKQEADTLGITYKNNIGAIRLKERIEEFYEKQTDSGSLEELMEKAEKVEEQKEPDVEKKKQPAKSSKLNIAAIRAKAFETKIVTISSNDKRENHLVTTAPLSIENEYFGISRDVPLDVPVELEVCLIELAKSLKVVMHVDEIIDGRRTGNKVPKLVHRYVINFEDIPKAS